MVALLVIALLHSRRTFGLALLVVAIVGSLNFDAFYQTEVNGDDAEGNFLRLELWEQNFEVTKDHLLLGTGVAGYAPYYLAFFPDRQVSTHSNLLDIFAETGLVGSALFIWFIVAAFRVRRARPATVADRLRGRLRERRVRRGWSGWSSPWPSAIG